MTVPTSLAPRASGPSGPAYRPDIDGLRAIAVLAVIAFHAFPGWVRGGFVGVDIFFVISGFLISSIIFGSLEKNGFSYAEFYARRMRRIFPALLAVMLACGLFGWFVLLSQEFRQLGGHIAAGAAFLSNFALWNESGYFDRAAETKPLLHWWSLAIEEQFYIVWPLLLGVVWKWKHNLLMITLGVLGVSLALGIYAVYHDPVAAFYSPVYRSWELMVGGILAYVTLHRPETLQRHPSMQSTVGALLLGIGVLLFNPQLAFPGAWALVPTVGAVLLISAGPQTWLGRHVLGHRLLVSIGLISYPLYLWHWPLLTYARIIEGEKPSAVVRMIAILASFILAWLTYVLLEKTIRHRKGPATIAVLASLMAGGLIAGLTIRQALILPRNSGPDLDLAIAAATDWEYPLGFEPLLVGGQTFQLKKAGRSTTVFIGDSHTEQYGPRLVDLVDADPTHRNSVVMAAEGGCPPIPGVYTTRPTLCNTKRDVALDLARQPEVSVVVLGGCWTCYFIDHTAPVGGEGDSDLFLSKNGTRHSFRDPAGAQLALDALEAWIVELRSRQKTVYLLLDHATGPAFDPKTYLTGSRLTRFTYTPPTHLAPIDPPQLALRDLLAALGARAGARVLDPMAEICSVDGCPIAAADGRPFYLDAGHLRPFYIREVAGFIDATLTDTLSGS